MRTKLRFKIINEFGSIKNFSKIIGYSRAQLSGIFSKKIIGSNTFWNKVQEIMKLSDSEILNCQRDTKKMKNDIL